MAFQITEILESQAGNILVNALHQNNPLTATIRDQTGNDVTVGESFPAELGYDEILDWKVIEDFQDDKSGIWEEGDGIHLLGRIHNILDYGDGKMVIDTYIQNGPEFFTVHLDATEDLSLDANNGLEIVVRHLYIYLTR